MPGGPMPFHLIQSLVETGDAKEIVGKELDFLLREYVRQGPHHVIAQSQVALEEA